MPKKKRCEGDSMASMTPSGATAVAVRADATSLTDW